MSQIDTTIPRVEVEGFTCPLGVYPTEPASFTPRQGYFSEFEPADAGDDETGAWEEWPDRYLYDVVVSHQRLPALLRSLFALLPGRVFPILDVLGHDAYREVDPYIAYEPVGYERFIDAFRRHRGWFLEDGMVGFGAMSLEPFLYVYVDEHKIVTIRAETALKEKIEKALAAFDLLPVDEPMGVDSVEHEHRETLLDRAPASPAQGDGAPPADAEPAQEIGPRPPEPPMAREQIIDELRDLWGLTLNIDPDTNVDDEGAELGATAWRCVVRSWPEKDDAPRIFEVLLVADCLNDAERYALDAAGEALAGPGASGADAPAGGPAPARERGAGVVDALDLAPEGIAPLDGAEDDEEDDASLGDDLDVALAERLTPDELAEALGAPRDAPLGSPGVRATREMR